MKAEDIKPGMYVEAPVTVAGETKLAVAVVQRVLPAADGGTVQLDFGPGVDVDGSNGSSTAVWRDVSALRPIRGPSSQAPLVAGAAMNAGHVTPKKATSTPDSASQRQPATEQTASKELSKPHAAPCSPAETPRENSNDSLRGDHAPTSIDQAVWTGVAGMAAIMECRKPGLTLVFMVLVWLHRELLMHDFRATPANATNTMCDRLTAVATEAPKHFEAYVRNGTVPAGFAEWATHVTEGGLRRQLHDSIEALQRDGASKPPAGIKKELGGKLPPPADGPTAEKKEKKKTKKQQQQQVNNEVANDPSPVPREAAPDAEVLPLTEATEAKAEVVASPVPDATTTAPPISLHQTESLATNSNAAKENANATVGATEHALRNGPLCRRSADFVLVLIALVVVSATTAYTYANPRVEYERVAAKFAGLGYITFFVIALYSALDTPFVRGHVAAAAAHDAVPQWLQWTYANVIDANTLTTFVLGHLWLNIALGAVWTILTGGRASSKKAGPTRGEAQHSRRK